MKYSADNTQNVLKEIYKGVPDSGLKLLDLIEKVPNWETYLTPKQREVAILYIKCLNACEVDYQLKLNNGTTHQRLFGSSTSKGAIGRLEEISKLLKEKPIREKQVKDNKKAISKKMKENIMELIQLLSDIPNYENYLTELQKERLYMFLQLKSIKACADHFCISEQTFNQTLFGNTGILRKLKEFQTNNWNEI